MTRIAILLAVAASVAGGNVTSVQSRLEKDFAKQSAKLIAFEGPTNEPSCGGTWLKVYMSGKEIRKLEWDVESSQRFIRREFYFSRGKAQLVIETSHWKLDESGERLSQPRHEYTRRYWLDDRGAGRNRVKIRRELREHSNDLLKDFRSRKAEFTRAKK